MYYSPTELEWLYRRLRAKNRCPIKKANEFSLVYLMGVIWLFLMFFNFYRSFLYQKKLCFISNLQWNIDKNQIDGWTSPYLVVIIGSACLLIP